MTVAAAPRVVCLGDSLAPRISGPTETPLAERSSAVEVPDAPDAPNQLRNPISVAPRSHPLGYQKYRGIKWSKLALHKAEI